MFQFSKSAWLVRRTPKKEFPSMTLCLRVCVVALMVPWNLGDVLAPIVIQKDTFLFDST
jgi:hypothetical protein